MRPRIFVGSSGEALSICYAIQEELDRDFEVTVWDQDVFRLTHGALDSLLDALDSADAGIFVLRPDDAIIHRGSTTPTTRDNVIFELGMFIGRLGRDRTFMVTPRSADLHLPSDLLGLTSAYYDAARFDRGDERAAVGPACRKIRLSLSQRQLRVAAESPTQVRLDRAMRRMSRDLEELLSVSKAPGPAVDTESSGALELTFGRMTVRLEPGRIQDQGPTDSRSSQSVIALPANEYFDDECITDPRSSLGAYVLSHFADRVEKFTAAVAAELTGRQCQRVPRASQRIGDSYGVGESLFLRTLAPEYRVILVSATTERTSVGLRAEPHFLYAALEGIVETMNECRLNSLTIPVLGSGHGGMPLPIAILFNLLALRSIADEDTGRRIQNVRIVVFAPSMAALDQDMLRGILAHFTAA